MNLNAMYSMLILFSVLSYGNRVSAQEAPMNVSNSDKIMAQATEIRNKSGLKAEMQFLEDQCHKAKPGDQNCDAPLYKVSEYYLTDKTRRQNFKKLATDEQLMRLMEKAKTNRELHKQVLFGEHLIQSDEINRNQKVKAQVMNDLATAYCLTDFTPDRAVNLWKRMSTEFHGTPNGVVGDVFTEALTDPKSIASLEALHRLSVMQSSIAGNFNGAMLSNQRVMRACNQEFYKAYISSKDIAKTDKLDLVSFHLYAAYMGGYLKDVPSIAEQVFELSERKGPIAQEAAMAVGLSNQKLGHYQKAVDNYLNFVRAFPDSPKVPQALLNMAMTEHSRGNFIEAAAQCAVLVEMFPKSSEALEAKARLITLSELEKQGKWNLNDRVKDELKSMQANLKPDVPFDVAKLWPVSQVEKIDIAQSVELSSATQSQKRLAQVISPSAFPEF